MSRRRTATALAATSALLLAVTAPAGATTSTSTSKGTAATTSVPLLVEAAGTSVGLGELAQLATTDDAVNAAAPYAMTGLTLANVGGTRFGELRTSSDGTTSLPGTSVERSTPAGGVVAEAASLLAVADDAVGSAAAALTTLETSAAVELADLEGVANPMLLQATVSDVVTTVDATGSAATHTLVFSGLDLGVEHLLGDALDSLPLPDLLALADQLPDVAPDGALGVFGDVGPALQDLLAAVAAAEAGADEVERAVAALLAADDGALAAVADLQATVDAIYDGGLSTPLDVGTVNTVIDALGDIPAVPAVPDAPAVPDVPGLLSASDVLDCGPVTTVVDLTDLVGAEDDLREGLECAAAAARAALSLPLDDLTDAVNEYLGAVGAIEDAVATLEALDLDGLLDAINDLLDQLLGADVIDSDPVRVSQSVRAVGGQLDGSTAVTTCSASTATVLGTILPSEGCDAGTNSVVQPALGAVNGLFGSVPGIDAGDGIVLELFGSVENAVSEADDGTVSATSVAEVLRLEVPTITVTPCDVAAGLACSLGVDLEDLLGDIDLDLGSTLDAAFLTADAALTSVDDLLTTLDTTLGVDAGAPVGDAADTALGALRTAVDGLDLDGLLSGESVTIPGATIVVDPQLEAQHQVTTAAVGTPDAPGGAPTPSDDPALPNTGGGAALFAVLALGAGALLWRRRED